MFGFLEAAEKFLLEFFVAMIPRIFAITGYEHAALPFQGRVYKNVPGVGRTLVLPSDIASITITVRRFSAVDWGNITVTQDQIPVGLNSLFSTLQTDSSWTQDAIGYNFAHTIRDEAFPGLGDYVAVYEFTPVPGSNFSIFPLLLKIKIVSIGPVPDPSDVPLTFNLSLSDSMGLMDSPGVDAPPPPPPASFDNIADLKSAVTPGDGKPMAATWNVVGYPLSWHCDQVRAGKMFLPSIHFPIDGGTVDFGFAQAVGTRNYYITNQMTDLNYINSTGLPLCLRTVNIDASFVAQVNGVGRYRLPLTAPNIDLSVLVYVRLPDGSYDDVKKIDGMGLDHFWGDEATLLANSLYVTTLQTVVTNPPWLNYVENNEGSYDKMGFYIQPNTDTWYPNMDTIAMRRYNWLLANPGLPPSSQVAEFWATRKRRYDLWYSTLDAHFVPAWRNKMITGAYDEFVASFPGPFGTNTATPPATFSDILDQVGYIGDGLCYDGSSPSFYADGSTLYDFTGLDHMKVFENIPAWQFIESKRPKAYREVSLNLKEGAVIYGLSSGKHQAMMPDIYSAYCEWLLWVMHEPALPVILRWYDDSGVHPTNPLFTNVTNIALLTAAGLPNPTHGEYAIAAADAATRILSNPTARDFWKNGTPVANSDPTMIDLVRVNRHYPVYPRVTELNNKNRLLRVSCNDIYSQWVLQPNGSYTGSIKVWATATKIGSQYLIYAYTPCAASQLPATVDVIIPGGPTVTINTPAPRGYYLV